MLDVRSAKKTPRATGATLSRPTAIDLFSGAGGMSLGFEQAGFDVVLSVDSDPYHVATHQRNFPHVEARCMSVADLSAADVRAVLGDRELDLVFGGPPCQGFSNMGLRDGADPRNSLVDQFVRLVAELRPRAFVMENVPGMQTGATSAIFDRAVRRLRAAGYTVTTPVLTLDAKHFGVPQARSRLFVIGARSDLGVAIPYPTGPCRGQPRRPTVLEAINDLPRPTATDADAALFEATPPPECEYALVARGLVPDPSDHSRPRTWDRKVCSGVRPVLHTDAVRELYRATPPGAMVPGHKLPRLDPSGLAPTLRAGSNSERGSHTAPRPVHPIEPRCITVREAARLHGYPDWFEFYPGKWHAYQQIGNSVCPPVARAVGAAVVASLGLVVPKRRGAPISLNSDFPLQKHQPGHRRLVDLDQLLKVVRWFADQVQLGRESRLTPQVVAAAVKATGASCPRIRPDQFVATIARSRNVSRLLAPLHALGYSIAFDESEPTVGVLVRKESPVSIEAKDTIKVRSRELVSARQLDIVRPERLSDLLNSREVTGLLQHLRIRVSFRSEATATGSARVAQVRSENSTLKALVIDCEGKTLPRRSRLAQAAAAASCQFAIVVAQMTDHHVLVIAFTVRGDGCDEVDRCAFRIESPDPPAKRIRRKESTPTSLPLFASDA